MKVLLKYSFIIIALILIQQCRKDNIFTTNENNQLNDATNLNFLIQITDEDNKVLSNAQLQIKGDQNIYTSDNNGIIFLSNISVPKIGRRATITRDGYFDQIKMLDGISNSKNTKQIKLVRHNSYYNFPINTGSEGEIHGGGLLKLPSTLQQADGSYYTGKVKVRSAYFNPGDKDFLLSAPGNMTAKDEENNIIILASLGMYNIDLYNEDGDELHIPEGENAIISFPIAPAHRGNIPSSIPLWSLDEDQGIWIQEGEANVSGDKMIAEVSHFSFWNIDLPYDFVDVCMTFVNNDQEVIPGLEIKFFVDQNLQFGHETTNSEGKICGKLPLNKSINVQIQFAGLTFDIEDLGPYENFEPNVVITVDHIISRVTGNTLDCSMSPIDNGYGITNYYSERHYLHYIDEQGFFKYYAHNDAAHQLTLINNEDNKSILIPISAQDLEQDLDLGTQSLCGLEINNTISGQVMFDHNEDGIPDTPLENILVEASLDNETKITTLTDANGNYSFTVVPQKYTLRVPEQSGKKMIASGDFSPDDISDTGDYNYKDELQCIVKLNEHDKDNNFLIVNSGFGTISGNFTVDLNNDGIGDKTLESAQVTLWSDSDILNVIDRVYTDINGNYIFENVPNTVGRIHEGVVGFNLSDYDHSPDPDGDDQHLGGNNRIPFRLKVGEQDKDNNFVFSYNKSTIVVQTLRDINGDGIGDIPHIFAVIYELYNRDNNGQAIGDVVAQLTWTGNSGFYSAYGIDDGEYVIKLSFIQDDSYKPIDAFDEIPDNNPPYDISNEYFLPINIVGLEHDDGNRFILTNK